VVCIVVVESSDLMGNEKKRTPEERKEKENEQIEIRASR
jgi:hypothetical protein